MLGGMHPYVQLDGSRGYGSPGRRCDARLHLSVPRAGNGIVLVGPVYGGSGSVSTVAGPSRSRQSGPSEELWRSKGLRSSVLEHANCSFRPLRGSLE